MGARAKDKDSYDIYSVSGFYGNGPKQASDAFMAAVKENGSTKSTIDALNEIRDSFASETSQGPVAVARFVGSRMPEPTHIKEFKPFLKTFQSETSSLEVEDQRNISQLCVAHS